MVGHHCNWFEHAVILLLIKYASYRTVMSVVGKIVFLYLASAIPIHILNMSTKKLLVNTQLQTLKLY